MYTLSTLIVVAFIAAVVGGLIGVLLNRSLSPQEQKSRTLESKLQNSEQQLKDYQEQVTEHFAQTAKLVNSLTQSYKEVHEHLASDALKLANVDISRQLLANDQDAEVNESALSDENFAPPRDWAPKAPGQAGTLSETYGLDEADEGYSRESSKEKVGG